MQVLRDFLLISKAGTSLFERALNERLEGAVQESYDVAASEVEGEDMFTLKVDKFMLRPLTAEMKVQWVLDRMPKTGACAAARVRCARGVVPHRPARQAVCAAVAGGGTWGGGRAPRRLASAAASRAEMAGSAAADQNQFLCNPFFVYLSRRKIFF